MDVSDRVGVIVIRVWEPAGEPGQLRARITEVTDLATGEPVVTAASDHRAILAYVEAWLSAFERHLHP
jgi:hypothetical protein